MSTPHLREYHRRRRALAKKMGVCCQCNDAKAAEARTKCRQCLTIETRRYQKAA